METFPLEFFENGRCHLCQIRDNDETMQHLFFKCPSVNKIIKEIEAIFNRSGLTANIEIKYYPRTVLPT
jgi:hypothetical protein